MEKNDFPLLLIVTRSRGLLELNSIIEGKSTPSEVLLNLIQSHDSFEQQRLHDMDEELMREKRENLKREQEDEYEQSRRADLAKQQAREQEERESKLRIEQRSVRMNKLPVFVHLNVLFSIATTTRIKSSSSRRTGRIRKEYYSLKNSSTER